MQHTQTVVELVRDQTTYGYTDDLAAASGNLFCFFFTVGNQYGVQSEWFPVKRQYILLKENKPCKQRIT